MVQSKTNVCVVGHVIYYVVISNFLFTFSFLVPPSFTITPSNQTVTEKDQITFTCNATGNPVPNITWTKDGKTVATGEKLSFEARRNHSGKYWCSADNGIGKTINTSVSFDVQCKFDNFCTLNAVAIDCSVLTKIN